MVFGILEDHKLENVPGTGLLSDRGRACLAKSETDQGRDLKRGTGQHSDIILIPQPSDDPRDPLNWPRWKKEACLSTLVFMASLTGVLISIATPGYVLLAKKFDTSVDDIASSFSAYLPSLAISTLLQNTLAVKYGHRIVYLLSTLVMFLACCWTALSPDLASVRVSRVFQGIGMAAPQTLVPSTIEHIYFVHERGSRSTIWHFSITAGTTFAPFVYGYLIQKLSWQFGFWLASVACGLSFVGAFLFVPETSYRHRALGTTSASRPRPPDDSEGTEGTGNGYRDAIKEMPKAHQDSKTQPPSGPPLFISQLKIYNGTFSDESIWKVFIRPFVLILSPVTWFIFVGFAMQGVWFGLLSMCSSTIFTIAYHFNAAQIGLTHLGGLVGVLLAMLFTGPLNDWAIVQMSQRNRGIFEPEYRLIFMLGALVGLFGYVGWAVGTDHHMPWMGAVACFAMVAFSAVVSAGAAVTYGVDTHGADALHMLSIVYCARNLILYGISFVANGIIAARGIKALLLILAACQATSWLVSVPMYVYGKRVRSFVARHPRLFSQAPDLQVQQSKAAAAPPQTGSKQEA